MVDNRLIDFIHSPLCSEGHPIRLLDLLPSSDSSSEIRCTIQHFNLDDHPAYKALSYVWGDATKTLPILVNEKLYHVTINCYAALRRLRKMGERRIWIDAICINQKNDEEKSAQVAFMRDIYYFAEEVIVWLGWSEAEQKANDEVNEELAIALIYELADALRTYIHKPGDLGRGDLYNRFIQKSNKEGISPSSWNALLQVFSHEWFKRLWVHQEIVVSLKSTAMFQYYTIPFEEIGRAAQAIDHLVGAGSANPFVLRHYFEMDLALGLEQESANVFERYATKCCYDREEKQVIAMEPLKVMSVGRRYKCLNPRDRVFALLGLINQDGYSRIRPDYTKSISEVYTSLMWSLIQDQRSIGAIGFAGVGYRDIEDGLPSWVVDWRFGRYLPFARRYKASLDYSIKMLSFYPSQELQVLGVHVDNLLTAVEPLGHVKDEINWESRARGPSLWKKYFNFYPDGSVPQHAWIRTITTDIDYCDPMRCRLSLERLLQIEKLARCYPDISPEQIEDIFLREKRSEDEYLRWIEYCLRFEKSIYDTLNGRRIFISKAGYMGIGPLTIQDGDMICVVLGYDIPLLVRKKDNYHVLVGECFVWGLMDGEALEHNAECEIFRFR
jgi:Heterokaryon incompatibility protein (HET)